MHLNGLSMCGFRKADSFTVNPRFSEEKANMAVHYFSLCAERNQIIIAENGAVKLLANTAKDAVDPQTLCMVAGALANLCGNGKIVS